MKRNKGSVSKRQSAKHPGEVLLNQFMKPLKLSANRLAVALHVSPQRIGEILNGRRGITAETALRLSKLLGTTAKFWLDLQSDFELSRAEEKWAHTIDQEIRPLALMKDITACPAITPKHKELSRKRDRPPASLKLEASQKKVYDLLSIDLVQFDALVCKSGLEPGELSATLTMLELSELVQRHPGDRYSKVAVSK